MTRLRGPKIGRRQRTLPPAPFVTLKREGLYTRYLRLTTELTTGEMMTTDTKLVTITDDNFATEIEAHEGLAMIDFWAAWCGPCRMVAPIVEELAAENADSIKVGKLDVDENQRTAMKFAVRSIPSILFFKDGRHVDTVVGAVPKAALERKIQQHI